MQYKLSINSMCNSCDNCRAICPTDAIYCNENNKYFIDSLPCTLCGICREVCPVNAVKMDEVDSYGYQEDILIFSI